MRGAGLAVMLGAVLGGCVAWSVVETTAEVAMTAVSSTAGLAVDVADLAIPDDEADDAEGDAG